MCKQSAANIVFASFDFYYFGEFIAHIKCISFEKDLNNGRRRREREEKRERERKECKKKQLETNETSFEMGKQTALPPTTIKTKSARNSSYLTVKKWKKENDFSCSYETLRSVVNASHTRQRR